MLLIYALLVMSVCLSKYTRFTTGLPIMLVLAARSSKDVDMCGTGTSRISLSSGGNHRFTSVHPHRVQALPLTGGRRLDLLGVLHLITRPASRGDTGTSKTSAILCSVRHRAALKMSALLQCLERGETPGKFAPRGRPHYSCSWCVGAFTSKY